MKHFLITIFFIFILIINTQCPTIGKFNHLQGRVDNLEKEIKEIEEKQRGEKEKVEKLYNLFKQTTEQTRKENANTLADLNSLNDKIIKMSGGIEEISYSLTRIKEEIETIKKFLDEKLGFSPVSLPPGFAEDKKTLLNLGNKSFEKGDWTSARGFFRRYIEKFPTDTESADLQFKIAETYLMEGKFSYAIREYQKVHDNYKENKNAPVGGALMRIVECLIKMNDCKKAEGVLKYIINYDKKSAEAEKAKEMLKKIKTECK